MKFSKEMVKGVCLGVIITFLVSSTIVFATGDYFKTSNGALFNVAHLAVGKNLVPIIEMPDQKPPIIIDGRTYVPLRAAVNSVGGDVTWDTETKTASVFIADTIHILQNGNTIFDIPRYPKQLQFKISISGDFTDLNAYYDTRWVLEKDGKEINTGWNIISVQAVNNGIMSTQNCEYDFANGGTYLLKYKINKAGSTGWLTVAQKKLVIK